MIDAIVNPYTGWLHQFGELPSLPHDPKVVLWGATLIPMGSRQQSITVGGAGWTSAAARLACLGEAIERAQPYRLPQDRTILASYADWLIEEPAVPPEQWVLFHPEQYLQAGFPFQPFNAETKCRWTCCRTVPEGTPMWVPEDIVFLYPDLDATHRFCPGISTGLACGQNQYPILLRGLQEIIERDALMKAWWGTYRLEEWDFDAVLAQLGDHLTQRIQRPNLIYHGYRVVSPYSAHVTIVTIAGEDQAGYCFSAGAACRETRQVSWEKALLEAIQGHAYVRYLRGTSQYHPSSEPRDFTEHALYYSLHPQKLQDTVFFQNSCFVHHDEEATCYEPLSTLRNRLGPTHQILWRMMAPSGTLGAWQVIKVLVPGLQPLHGNHLLPHLGGKSWTPRTLTDWKAIPPHPFP